MLLFSFLALQATAVLPDIELNARVRARSVTIERQGTARLTLTTQPDGGNIVDVRAPEANGRTTLENVDVVVTAEARIADASSPQNILKPIETAPRR